MGIHSSTPKTAASADVILKRNILPATEDISYTKVPSSLRPFYYFFTEAQRCVARARAIRDETVQGDRLSASLSFAALASEQDESLKRLSVSFINQAFKLITESSRSSEFNEAERDCLNHFKTIRGKFCDELKLPFCHGISDKDLAVKTGATNGQKIPMQLLSEARSLFALAQQFVESGFKEDALQHYHMCVIFYKIVDTQVQGGMLERSSLREDLFCCENMCLGLSGLRQNCIVENINNNVICSNVYDMHMSDRVGKGSYGSVYEAIDRRTKSKRAVKVMMTDRATAYYLRKVHNEIALLKRIDHPNILKLHEVYFGKKSVYLVTNLCVGGDLYEKLKQKSPDGDSFRYTEERTSSLILNTLSAVNYLHKNMIVHRDLKLENLVLEEKSGDSPLRLIDLGLSKQFYKGEKMCHRVGSCYYMAPEILSGSYDERVDVWAIGVITYMLISGCPPFYGKTQDEVFISIKEQQPVFTDSKLIDISSDCVDFILKLLTKDCEKRMTIEEALRHPFIARKSQADTASCVSGKEKVVLSEFGSRNYVSKVKSVSSMGETDIDSQSSVYESINSSSHSTETLSKDVPKKLLIKSSNNTKALESTFLSSNNIFNELVVSKKQILLSFEIFYNANPLVQVVLSIVGGMLDSTIVKGVRAEFEALDWKKDGTISQSDFVTAMSSFEVDRCADDADAELIKLYRCVAQSFSWGKSRGLTYTEYIGAAICGRSIDEIPPAYLDIAFSILDPQNVGFISASGIHTALGDEVSEDRVHEIMSSLGMDIGVGIDSDYTISHELFLRSWGDFKKSSLSLDEQEVQNTLKAHRLSHRSSEKKKADTKRVISMSLMCSLNDSINEISLDISPEGDDNYCATHSENFDFDGIDF